MTIISAPAMKPSTFMMVLTTDMVAKHAWPGVVVVVCALLRVSFGDFPATSLAV